VRRAQVFFGICLSIALLLGIGALLTIPDATNLSVGASSTSLAVDSRVANDDSPNTVDGFAVWQSNACAGCHTLLGAGGGYASDLTRIVARHGADELRAVLRHELAAPSLIAATNARIMPRLGLTRGEIEALIAFLSSVSASAPLFPPQPLIETAIQTGLVAADPFDAVSTPVERGRRSFGSAPANCASCHSLEPDSIIVGPSLAGVAVRALTRVPGQSATTYLRNSILYPSDYLVPGYADAMAKNLGGMLTTDQIDDVIAFLLTLG